ncbi:hypothetical protein CE91St14_03430 [Porphyromonas somerae]|nr:hypothetical protein CE91St14_03430 [Porphyromonas somerae]
MQQLTNGRDSFLLDSSIMVQTKEIKATYSVGGNEITLTPATVATYLTRGNGKVTEQDVMLFISLCKFNKLNPFLNEAYLVKYGTQPAQMITSKEAYFKRAEENQNFKGIRSGIIIGRQGQKDQPWQVLEVEGCFQAPGDVLLGGWAMVYRSDRDYPVVAKVNLNEYDKQQSVWNEKKSTMIAKIAKVQALREAFPTQLGAMYTAEEVAEYSEVPTTQVEATSQTQATSAMEKAKQAMAKSVAEKSESTEEVPQEATATAEPEAVKVESKERK